MFDQRNALYISKNKFYYNKICFDLEDLITIDFMEDNKYKVDLNKIPHYFANELFLNLYLKHDALLFFLKNNLVEVVIINKSNKFITSLLRDICYKHNITFINKLFIDKKISVIIKGYLIFFSSFFYIFFRFLNLKSKVLNSKITNVILIRDSATKEKVSNFPYFKLFFDIKNNNSLYCYIPIYRRFIFLWSSLCLSIKMLRILNNEVNYKVGKYSTSFIYTFYSPRLLETYVFEFALMECLSKPSIKNIYTGCNLDRFAFIEQKVSIKLAKTLIVLPHGIEYGFKFPVCFTGDVFYSTSIVAQEYLNNLYKTNKFVYDNEINKLMYNFKVINVEKTKKIIFFTEPNDIEVNKIIIKDLLEYFHNSNLQVYIKLHPNDKIINYKELKVNFISSFKEAISHNYCIARKSTILFEATQNNSEAIAILTNIKDSTFFSYFPTLSKNKKIIKFYNTFDLSNYLLNKQHGTN
jgi:hypothetical protein